MIEVKRKEKFLRLFKLFEERLNFDFDVNSFQDKIKLQKYVYISEFFGFNHDYQYNKYIRGPYSPDLADDYYSIDKSDIPGDYSSILNDFNHAEFLDFVEDKDARRLELTATVLSVWKDYRYKFQGTELASKVIDTSADIKSKASKENIKFITRNLEKKGIIDLDMSSQN